MITFHSEATKLRRAKTELNEGLLVAPFECPERVDLVLDRIRETRLGDVQAPTRYGLEPVLAVHDAGYVEFLASCWEEWKAIGMAGEAIPNIWPSRSMPGTRIPEHIEGRLGYYAQTGETSICANTFEAADISKDIALSALGHTLKSGEPSFGLCRPPGHHASSDQFGGYCFFNNAAIAADQALKHGLSRVAVLDIDFHHGNGTQEIFYGRDDVIVVSLHGDPLHCFPYYLGHGDETGSGRGEGYNVNIPMPPGTGYGPWSAALVEGLGRIRHSGAELLIVSLGVDTFEHDPISSFKLTSDDYPDIGRRLAALGLPTVFLLEGGYAVKEIGINVVNVLSGFEAA